MFQCERLRFRLPSDRRTNRTLALGLVAALQVPTDGLHQCGRTPLRVVAAQFRWREREANHSGGSVGLDQRRLLGLVTLANRPAAGANSARPVPREVSGAGRARTDKDQIMGLELGCFVAGQIAARTDGQLDEFDSSSETCLPGLSDETPMSSGGVLDHRRSQTSLTPKRTYAIVDHLDDDEGAIRSNGNFDLVCSPMANSVRDSFFDDSADSKRVNQAFDVVRGPDTKEACIAPERHLSTHLRVHRS